MARLRREVRIVKTSTPISAAEEQLLVHALRELVLILAKQEVARLRDGAPAIVNTPDNTGTKGVTSDEQSDRIGT